MNIPQKEAATSRAFLLIMLTFALTLTACSAGTTGTQTTPTNTAIAQAQPTATATPLTQTSATATSTPLPTCPPNNIQLGSPGESVIPPTGWTTFTDTLLHYAINYPSNWIIPNGPCSGAEFEIFNHHPIPASGGPAFPPGGFYIDVAPMPNPSQATPAAFAELARPNMPGGPPCAAPYTMTPVRVAGRDAVLATCPAGSSEGEGDPSQGYNYFVPNGTTMLVIIQRDLVNGQPSPILAQMLASLTFTN